MRPGVAAIVYNKPLPSVYNARGEEAAEDGVMDELKAVKAALLKLGYEVRPIPLEPPVESARKQLENLKADLVFNLFEGFSGSPETEADIADILAGTGIPFTGNPSPILRLGLDKPATKRLLRDAGIDTPGFQMLGPGDASDFRLNFPCIIKPPAEDASHGLTEKSVVNSLDELSRQLAAFGQTYPGPALVEEFIDGREFNITVLGDAGNTALPISEIEFSLPPGKPKILTFDAKWQPNSPYFKGTRVRCPAKIPEGIKVSIEVKARAAFLLLGCRGYARVDLRMDNSGRVFVIEVNPNPDLSPDYGAALQAKTAGMDYPTLIKKIIELALVKEDGTDQHSAHDRRGQASPDADPAGYPGV